MSRALLVLATLLSLLSGCAFEGRSGPRAPMLIPPELRASVNSHLSPAAQWPAANWWEVYGLTELNQLIRTALHENPSLQVAAARLQQAQSLVDVQGAELYPSLEANVSFSAQGYSANSTQARLAGENFRQLLLNPLVLRYHLDFWQRDQAALQAAVGKAMAVATEQEDAKLLLVVALSQHYFALMLTQQKLEGLERIVAARDRLLALVQVQSHSGLVPATAELQASIALNAAKQRVTVLQRDVVFQQNLLAALVGQGPDWGRRIQPAGKLLPKAPALPADLRLNLLAHRPDVSAARWYTQAAADKIKVAQTAFYPDVNLLAFGGLHSVSFSDVLLQGASLAYAVGPSISLPLFEGGRLRAQLQYQQAEYDAAVQRYNHAVLHAIQEVADAVARWRELQDAEHLQAQVVAAASQLAYLSQRLNETGLSDVLAATQTQLALLESQLQQLQLQGEQLQASVQLYQALGGGFHTQNHDRTTQPYEK